MSDILSRIIKNANNTAQVENLTPEKFVTDYPRPAYGAIQMLDRLGLVERDRGSVLGWRATAQLEKMAAKAMAKPDRNVKRQESELDDFILDLLADTAGIGRGDVEGGSAYRVLEELRLVRTNTGGAGVVTKALLRLILVDAYRIHSRIGQ